MQLFFLPLSYQVTSLHSQNCPIKIFPYLFFLFTITLRENKKNGSQWIILQKNCFSLNQVTYLWVF